MKNYTTLNVASKIKNPKTGEVVEILKQTIISDLYRR